MLRLPFASSSFFLTLNNQNTCRNVTAPLPRGLAFILNQMALCLNYDTYVRFQLRLADYIFDYQEKWPIVWNKRTNNLMVLYPPLNENFEWNEKFVWSETPRVGTK